jgi:4,5-DOPA dioxygenase extradiol
MRMPALFVGHGSPMNVIEDNPWSRGFAGLSALIPEPQAILAISAHWYVDGILLTGDEAPRTIHDFSGFPGPLYEIGYPAPGDPGLAEHVRGLIGAERAALTTDWGLDHGSWSVLHWMYPAANIPVVQLSIDRRLDPQAHLNIGEAIAPLRDEGVLILASGNITHNLRDAFERMRAGASATPDWAQRFDRAVAQALIDRDTERLTAIWPDSDDGRRCHPTPDHWLPLLYAYGASAAGERVQFPIEGFDLGSLSMRTAIFCQDFGTSGV